MKKILSAIQIIFFTAVTNAQAFNINNQLKRPNAEMHTGFFNVYKVKDRFYFEIPDSMLRRDILIVNRVVTGDSSKGLYRGDEIGPVGKEKMIRFEKGEGDTINLCTILYNSPFADSALSESSIVDSFSKKAISCRFPVKALTRKGKSSIIDATDIIKGGKVITDLGVGSVLYVKAFPTHIEIGATRDSAGYSMNTSMLLLPKIPMRPRFEDDRVGFRATDYYDRNGVKKLGKVHRWRMEPKPEDMEKYERGELVEPQKPIVFYIDTAVPKKWLPYFIQAVNAWQPAFEKAGFKNAIYALPAPTKEEDSTWSLVDAAHSDIVYEPSAIENAFGYHICDPRSGEIVESHVDWHRDITKMAHDWYMIEAGPNDPNARKMVFDDSLMGRLLCELLTHEIGHAIGLEHAMASSSTVPVEKLRDRSWVDTFGICPSIMDYVRFNYVAQPEDSMTEKELMNRIGDYDKWAVEWGYRYFPILKDSVEEKKNMNEWVSKKLKDPRLWWEKEDANIVVADPRMATESLGNDIIAADRYGIKNLKRVMANLPEWTKDSTGDDNSLKRIYAHIVSTDVNDRQTGQYVNYMFHALGYIGGVYSAGDKTSGPVYVPKTKQQEAVSFLNNQFYTTPTWLTPSEIMSKIQADPVSIIGRIQQLSLDILFKMQIIKLAAHEAIAGDETYTAADLLDDLKKGIWGELINHKSIDVHRQNLQKRYINSLTPLLYFNNGKDSELANIVREHLVSLKKEIKAALPAFSDVASRNHLEDAATMIDKALNRENK